jgi:hypothetical protein
MNNHGVFHWIREGVRRSVLLGFSDAVEQLGVPSEGNDLNPQLLNVLRQTATPALENSAGGQTAPRERRRLGRSLDQLRDNAPKSATAEDES